MKLFSILLLSLCFLTSRANTYYVSSTGNDSASGQTISDAWLTINKVNSFNFFRGDSLLFEGGSTFYGSINNASLGFGGVDTPIIITSYGTGRAIINSGNYEGISLGNAYNVTISKLIFQGSGYKINPYYYNGIGIYMDKNIFYPSDYIVIDSVDISGYGGWGANILCASDSFGYNHLRVTNSSFHNNGFGGFQLQGSYDSLTNSKNYNHHDVYIGNCSADSNFGRSDYTYGWSGSGIMIESVVGGTIEYCEASYNGKENAYTVAGPIGIFIGDCKNVIIQNSVSHHNQGGAAKKDGGGFDLDMGTQGCVIQYCNSYQNDGAGYGLYEAATPNILTNDTIRYNTSTNDGRNYSLYGALTFWGASPTYKVTNSFIYGNTINLDTVGYAMNFIYANFDNVQIYNNTFCLKSPAQFLNYFQENPIPAGVYVYNNTFPCTIQPQQSFIIPVAYRGAFPTGSMWISNWTNNDPQNYAYVATDSVIQTNISSDLTLVSTSHYLLKGPIYVNNGATLNIQPGTLIRADKTTPNTALIVTKGSKIYARGTYQNPIVFTSNQPAGQRGTGDWAGLYILGKASVNTAGGIANLQNFDPSPYNEYGGGLTANDNDSSGMLQYVRVEFAGANSLSGNRGDGLTLAGVGRGTTVNYIQVSFSKNDAFKWMGGAVNARYITAYKNTDDNWDVRYGYHGAVQYAFGIKDPSIVSSVPNEISNGMQSSNDSTASYNNPLTSPVFANVTEIGPLRGSLTATVNSAFKYSIRYNSNSHLRMFNSLFMDYPAGVDVEGIDCINAANGNYVMQVPASSPGNLTFKNNLIAGTQTNNILSTDGSWNMAGWYGLNQNDSLPTTTNILVAPYRTGTNNSYIGDYRPTLTSPALKNWAWTDSSFYNIDSSGNLLNLIPCPITIPPPATISGPLNAYPYIQANDTAKFFITARSLNGALRYDWTVPAGATIQSGQGTDTIVVQFSSSLTSGNITATQTSYCGLTSAPRTFLIQNAPPVTYTFIGDGNWSVASNWQNGLIPPSQLLWGSQIVINPSGTCIMNVTQSITKGATLTVTAGKTFTIPGKLTIQ